MGIIAKKRQLYTVLVKNIQYTPGPAGPPGPPGPASIIYGQISYISKRNAPDYTYTFNNASGNNDPQPISKGQIYPFIIQEDAEPNYYIEQTNILNIKKQM
jgi:hypothetical protein